MVDQNENHKTSSLKMLLAEQTAPSRLSVKRR